MLTDFVNRTNVGVIERGGSTGLPLESRHPDRILAERVWENLDRHLASQLLIFREIHFSHATFSKGREDFVVSEQRAGSNHTEMELRMRLEVNLKMVLQRGDAPTTAGAVAG